GGSYGGRGSFYADSGTASNPLYGSESLPAELGSGGGGKSAGDVFMGGNGGGRINLQAHDMHIDGQLRSDGQDISGNSTDYDSSGAGGSGGAIALEVFGGSFSGNGVVRASG